MSRIVKLNVGGAKYTTSISTIMKFPDSMLGTMIQQPQELQMVQHGQELFIDRDGDVFKYIMRYLRDGDLIVLPEGNESILKQLLLEAQFFMLDGLKAIIKKQMKPPKSVEDTTMNGWKVGDIVSLHDSYIQPWDNPVFKDFTKNGLRLIGDPVGPIVQFGCGGKATARLTCRCWTPPSVESIKEITATYSLPLRTKQL